VFIRRKQSNLKQTKILAGFETEITYKPVRNINMRLKPGKNIVYISAPRRVSQAEITRFIESKRQWLRENLAKMRDVQPAKPPRMKAGELHYVWGRPLALQPFLQTKGRPHWRHIDYDLTHLFFPISDTPETREVREKRLKSWYLDETQRAVAQLLPYWQARMEIEVLHLSYRNMKSRWGTCFINEGHIRLNTELAKYPPACLEYVLVHEIAHFYEPAHDARFYKIMDRYLPDWQARRQLLNSLNIKRLEDA
jgi:predicted metal-dependent hydrolase